MSRKVTNREAHTKYGNQAGRGKPITVCYWNKGSSFLSNKKDDIAEIINTHKPLVLGLGEAQFKQGQNIEEVQQPGYTLHLDSCQESLGVSRCAVYTHNSLVVKRRDDLENKEIATVWLQLGLPNQKGILVMCGYRQWRLPGRPDSGSVTAQRERWGKLISQWEKALNENKEVICALDANIDALTWTSLNLPANHSNVKLKPLIDDLFEKILPHGVTQLVQVPTHSQFGVATKCLDHMYSTNPEKLSNVEATFTGMSDHKLIKIQRFSKSLKNNPRYVRKRCFKSFDKHDFKLRVSQMPELVNILESSCANQAAEILTAGLTRELDSCAPVRTIQMRSKYAPHLQESTKQLMDQRNTAQRTAATSGNIEDWRIYRGLRNKCVAAQRLDRQIWEKDKLSSSNNSPAKLWKSVKGIIGWGSTGPPTKLFHAGKYVSSPAGLATTLNNYFINKVKKLRASIPVVESDPLSKLRESMENRQCSFNIQLVTEKVVLDIITSLNNSTSTGVDFIDTQTIKLVKHEIVAAVTRIINLSIESSTFPSIFKHSQIIPLKKNPSLNDLECSSYRPVNLLPVMGKIVEKAIFNQLVIYLEENRLIHPNHHGGRKGHSTTTALVQMYNNWMEQLEEGHLVGIMMIDQSAAFDLCDHKLLIEKLKLLGVEEKSACWMENYLINRSQSTLVDGYLSAPIPLPPCSVIQGGIGSGLLYLVYTNDLPDVIHNHKVNYENPEVHCKKDGSMVNFVDDGTVYFTDKDPEVVSQKLRDHYGAIEDYMNSNKLVINSDKTHLIVMAGRGTISARRLEVQVEAGTDTIEQSESEKLLGGVIHNTGRWNEMIKNGKNSIVRQLSSRLNGMKKLRQADFKTKLAVATGIIQSKIQYLLPLFGGAPDYLLNSIQVQQLKAARFVCGYNSYYWSTQKLLHTCGWLSIKQQEFYSTCLLAHKISSTRLPRNLYSAIVQPHTYNTRAAAQGQIRYGAEYRGDSEMTRSSFKYRAQKYYNAIPADMKRQSLATFKVKLKNHAARNIPVR